VSKVLKIYLRRQVDMRRIAIQQIGFTLVELLVAVAISVVVITLAVPSFGKFYADNLVSGRTNDLVSDIQLVRTEALRRRQRVSICASADGATCSVSNDWSTGWIVFTDDDTETGNTAGVIDGSDEIVQVRDNRSGTTRSTATDNGGTGVTFIQFLPTGYLRNHASAITLSVTVQPPADQCRTGANQRRTVSIFPFGSLETTRADCS
jgi:type IV fimbrial biogenesis protein FimT